MKIKRRDANGDLKPDFEDINPNRVDEKKIAKETVKMIKESVQSLPKSGKKAADVEKVLNTVLDRLDIIENKLFGGDN